MDMILDKVYLKIIPLFYTVAYVLVHVQHMFNGIAFLHHKLLFLTVFMTTLTV